VEELEMRLTIPGKDVIAIREGTFSFYKDKVKNTKVHLIKLDFEEPNEDKILDTLNTFPETNRYIIDSNVKLYNSFLKNTNKKYYIKNKKGTDLISFFRKNNKILMDFTCLNLTEFSFIVNNLSDLLRNVEIIMVDKSTFDDNENILKFWKGNVVIFDEAYQF
jgi:hypothetical protein